MFPAFSSGSGVRLTSMEILPNTSTSTQKSHCRFCAELKNCTELLDFSKNTETLNQLIRTLRFFEIDYVDLFDLKMPKTVCEACYDKVLKCYSFFLTVKESQKILKEMVFKEDEKIEEVNDRIEIKIEPIEDVEINIANVKQEHDTENEIYNTEIESNSYTQQPQGSPDTSNSDMEQGFIVPIENATSSTYTTENNDTIKTTSYPILKSKLACQNFSTIKTDTASFENRITAFKTEVNDTSNAREKFNSMVEIMIENNMKNSIKEKLSQHTEEVSWTGYPWRCVHCQTKQDTMLDLRNHSIESHKRCFAYECADCPESFNMFHPFIEHVRRHRYYLRYYCPHCNERFSSVAGCTQHVLAYWSSGHKICNWCGDVYPNAEALNAHKSTVYQVRLPLREARKVPRVVPSASKQGAPDVNQPEKTWVDYDWGCVECTLSFASINELRAHSQAVHNKCYSMRCADCLAVKYDYPHFVKHVVAHRPYLRKYCAYCNQYIEDANELTKHTEEHFAGPQRACYSCGQLFHNKDDEIQHVDLFSPRRTQKYLTTEDLTCQVCQKVLTTVGSLKAHKQIHKETRTKDHSCHLCGKQFCSKSNLKHHMLRHDNKQYDCKVCNRTFSCERYLRNHVLTHVEDKPYECDLCAKRFIQKHMLKQHINSRHSNKNPVKRFKCGICSKGFKHAVELKTHVNSHTGITPYNCLNCEKSFTNWGNCNKHMIRIHGTTLAATKMTERGRVPIGEEMPEITNNVKEWMAEVIKPKKVKKK